MDNGFVAILKFFVYGFKPIPPIGSAYFYFYFLNFSYVSKTHGPHPTHAPTWRAIALVKGPAELQSD